MKQSKLYRLKVVLSHDKNIWRRIEMLGQQSLEQLHDIIFTAFDRFDAHLYSFYLTKPGSKARNRFALSPEYTAPQGIEVDDGFGIKQLHDASRTPLAELNLKANGTFEYLFDFGDEWLHEITVEKILDLYPDGDYPKIIMKKGESPSQYPNHEEENEYELWERTGAEIRQENSQLLEQFTDYLSAKKLSKKTIDKHRLNIDFFINEYLLYDTLIRPTDGINAIDGFLGSWFIRKAMWASVATIKTYLTSFKHFYTFMAQIGLVERVQLLDMKEEIKECKEEWLEAIRSYDEAGDSMADMW